MAGPTAEDLEDIDYESHDGFDYKNCDDCGGLMSWCTCCEVWNQDCCIDYGTCQCS